MESGTPGGKPSGTEEISTSDPPGSPGRQGGDRAGVPAESADLAATLHEVSNALTVIVGWLERARAGDEGFDPARAVQVASVRARQARDLVRRAIGAQVPPDPPRALGAVVEDAVVGLLPHAARAAVKLEPYVAKEVAEALVPRPATVVQILTNLLLNAVSASPKGSRIRVEALARGVEGVVVAVEDEGPGISPERRPRLFEGGVSTRPGGAGIGLRHAAALARELGGSLELAESARGSRFELELPAALDADAPVSSGLRGSGRAAGLPGLDGARILVVEDDHAVIDLLDTVLSAHGATIVTVRRGRDLADALRTGPFSAALFDLSPIQDDVAGALSAVRAASPAATLVVMSGSAIGLPALPGGCDAAWVRKPFEIDEIVRALGTPAKPASTGG